MIGNAVTLGTFLIHTVFSTRGQAPLITPEIEPLLYDKISKVLYDECFSPALMIGGDVEHVHVLYVNARDRSIDFVINQVKKKSSAFIRKWSKDFEWQESYAAVTTSRTNDEIDKDYIRRQKEIHRSLSYKDEFRQFLTDNGIEYEEDGLWD